MTRFPLTLRQPQLRTLQRFQLRNLVSYSKSENVDWKLALTAFSGRRILASMLTSPPESKRAQSTYPKIEKR